MLFFTKFWRYMFMSCLDELQTNISIPYGLQLWQV